MLDHIGVFLDDRPSSFELWLESKLDGLATGIARDVGDWGRLLHDGGPRSRARHAATVWNYLNRIRPVLLQWSARYDHLREVTRDDVLTHLETVQGSQRQTTIIALRSLFGRAKKNGTIFKNPTSRIRVGQREEGVIQPLEPEHINGSIASVTRPADRLILALAAVHAARPAAIRASNSTTSTSAISACPSTAAPADWMSSPSTSPGNGWSSGAAAGLTPPTRTS
ncbi:hypothetical protein [Streptomyces sp. NBC_01237]|uniref:hypothetical protein n=1 Tax=Streptomyces sp. NBC_01237 TaxID=2903790 RepID=UPI002DD989F5|nr:hypothetical protein [Streptomyces sp. NBC_01237]WRZ70209.1 hypothetical protein OG251_00325 [Streptomyces sp. NBC_01237]